MVVVVGTSGDEKVKRALVEEGLGVVGDAAAPYLNFDHLNAVPFGTLVVVGLSLRVVASNFEVVCRGLFVVRRGLCVVGLGGSRMVVDVD